MVKKNYTWYVEPLNVFTNGVIAREVSEEDFVERKIDNRRFPVKLWTCETWFIRYLSNSRKQLGLSFKVYSQAGGGKLKDCTFLYKKKKKTAV